MTIHILTSDVVPANQLSSYIGTDWSGVDNIRAGWSVAFGPITRVLFLQEQVGGTPPSPPPLPEAFTLEKRERQWLDNVSPHRPTPPEIAVLEMRTYEARPGQGARFLELMLAALPIRQRYSANFGVWSSLSGTDEQILHLWGYRSLEERTAVRARLKDDTEWNDYTHTILPMLRELNSIILTPLIRC